MADPARPQGTEVLQVAADITSTEGRSAVFKLRQDFDIVITNAGGPPPGDFRQWDRDTWIKAVDANMLTPIELIKATVDGMAARGFGRIGSRGGSSDDRAIRYA
jgi:3-oxoacyl-[acyl-carrier protein] reductase